MNLTPEEINSLAVIIANILAKGKSKKQIIEIKNLIGQIICNLTTYLID